MGSYCHSISYDLVSGVPRAFLPMEGTVMCLSPFVYKTPSTDRKHVMRLDKSDTHTPLSRD